MKQFLWYVRDVLHNTGDATFTTQSSFDANTSNLTTITFEGIASNGTAATEPATGLTISGVHFTAGGDSTLYVYGNGYSLYNTSVLASSGGSAGDSIVITLPTDITAVGLNYDNFDIKTPITFTFSNGTTLSETPTGQSIEDYFVGITSSVPIASLTISQAPSGESLNIDNFAFGTSGSSAPEPASLVLVAGSLLAFGGLIYGRAVKAKDQL